MAARAAELASEMRAEEALRGGKILGVSSVVAALFEVGFFAAEAVLAEAQAIFRDREVSCDLSVAALETAGELL